MFLARKFLFRAISRNEIEVMVKDFTKFYIKDDITLDKSFEHFGISPIDRVEIIAAIQFKTRASLEQKAALGVRTFNDLIDLIVIDLEKKEHKPK